MKNFTAILFLIFFSLTSSANEALSCSKPYTAKQSLAGQIIQCELLLDQNISNDIDTIRQSIYLANLYRKAGDTNKSRNQLEQISIKAKGFGVQALYEVSFAQGVNSYHSRHFINSLAHFKLAYQYANEQQDIKALANVYNALANIAQVFSDYQTMSYLLEKSLIMYKELNDAKGSIKVLNNLGNAYRHNNDDNKALIMYRQALLNQIQQSNHLNAAHTRINMARSLIKVNQQHKAIELLTMSIRDFTEIGAVHRIIETNGLIARIYLNLEDFPSSEKYLQSNNTLKLQIDSNHFDPESELVQADFYRAVGKTQLAKQILINGVNKSREQRNIEQLKKYLNTLASLLVEMDQIKLSNQYWQEYSDVLTEQLEQKKQYFGKLNFIRKAKHIKNVEANTQEKIALNLTNNQFIWVATLMLISCISFFIYKNKKERLKKSPVLNNLQEDTVVKVESTFDDMPLVEETPHIQVNTIEQSTVDIRQRLVELMLLATQLWEQETQLSRLELAEQSKIWKVTIDDGRLRVRAMERYLNTEKLPTKPRWRNVIRTCHYVLKKCDKTSAVREELVTKLTEYLNIIKQQASR